MRLAYCFSGNYSKAVARRRRAPLDPEDDYGVYTPRRARAGRARLFVEGLSHQTSGGVAFMKRLPARVAGAAALLLACAAGAAAQAGRVEMRIDGYLCGS